MVTKSVELLKGVDIIEGKDYRAFNKPNSMGIVQNVAYIACLWPSLDNPTALFAEGSSGIYVQGPPTPRNVLFPIDTVALPTRCNRASYPNPPQYEELADVPTRLDCFFQRDIVTKTVVEDVLQVKTVEVEPGIFTEVKYHAPTEVVKTELTVVSDGLDRATAEITAKTVALEASKIKVMQ